MSSIYIMLWTSNYVKILIKSNNNTKYCMLKGNIIKI